jgi:hypothetical protein
VAGLSIGVGAALIAAASGGNLGAFGHLGAHPLWFGLLAFAWFGAIGAGVALVLGHRVPEDAVDETEPADEALPLGSRGANGSPPVIAVPAPVDAELVVEPSADANALEAPVDIVDAEVVEPDLTDGSNNAGR